jgi:DNA-binding transcriptional ArsR family regulator
VNVSSIHKDEFYPTPELKNVFSAAENLRTAFSIDLDVVRDGAIYKSITENIEALYENLIIHYKESYAKEQALVAAASTSFTDKQRKLIMWLSNDYDEEMVYTVLIDRLSRDMRIPKSTVRWNLRGLRDAGLIKAGDRANKGVNVELTDMGRIMADYLLSITNTEHI